MCLNKVQYTLEEWQTEAMRRFGDDPSNWAFVCPVCGHVATVKQYEEAGAGEEAIGFSCIGRWTGAKSFKKNGKGPCNYAGGGLFQLNPTSVVDAAGNEHLMMAFAPKGDCLWLAPPPFPAGCVEAGWPGSYCCVQGD